MGNTTAVVDKLKDKLLDFAILNGPKILAAIAIMFVGFMIARWVDTILMRALNKKDIEPPLRMLIGRLVKLLIFGFALVIALGTAGVNVTAMVAGIGVAGVGIGLAAQGI